MAPELHPPYFVCPECVRRFDASGDCPDCPDEPLLDIRVKQVRFLLRDIDANERGKREGWAVWASVPIGMVVGALAIAVIPSEVYDLLPGPRLAFYAAGFILPAMGAFAVLRKKLQPRPRFPFIGGSHTEV